MTDPTRRSNLRYRLDPIYYGPINSMYGSSSIEEKDKRIEDIIYSYMGRKRRFEEDGFTPGGEFMTDGFTPEGDFGPTPGGEPGAQPNIPQPNIPQPNIPQNQGRNPNFGQDSFDYSKLNTTHVTHRRNNRMSDNNDIAGNNVGDGSFRIIPDNNAENDNGNNANNNISNQIDKAIEGGQSMEKVVDDILNG